MNNEIEHEWFAKCLQSVLSVFVAHFLSICHFNSFSTIHRHRTKSNFVSVSLPIFEKQSFFILSFCNIGKHRQTFPTVHFDKCTLLLDTDLLAFMHISAHLLHLLAGICIRKLTKNVCLVNRCRFLHFWVIRRMLKITHKFFKNKTCCVCTF